jgi:hypothetical protein
MPYLKAIKNLGFTVIGVDKNPKAPGAAIADKSYTVGYDDITALSEIALKEKLNHEDKVFTASAHFAYEGASRVADNIGIKYLEPSSVDLCLDKTKFYELLTRLSIPVPPYKLFGLNEKPKLDNAKTYYIKSDYGKTPNYCYRVIDGRIPALPKEHDNYFRKSFLVQEEVEGIHYRINMFADSFAIFLKLTDNVALPMPIISSDHNYIIAKLKEISQELKSYYYLLKFDLIISKDNWYVIDIGLDPPMRLRLLYDYYNCDFYNAYVQLYLFENATFFREWHELCIPILIGGANNAKNKWTEIGG